MGIGLPNTATVPIPIGEEDGEEEEEQEKKEEVRLNAGSSGTAAGAAAGNHTNTKILIEFPLLFRSSSATAAAGRTNAAADKICRRLSHSAVLDVTR